RLRMPLGPGLNVITGETGAGKSLLIDALGLVSGARADTSLIRHGAETARVEALFDRLPEPLIAVREIATRGRDAAPPREYSPSPSARRVQQSAHARPAARGRGRAADRDPRAARPAAAARRALAARPARRVRWP